MQFQFLSWIIQQKMAQWYQTPEPFFVAEKLRFSCNKLQIQGNRRPFPEISGSGRMFSTL